MNNKSFEDRKRTLEEIQSLFFHIYFVSLNSFVYPLMINYYDFFVPSAPS
jgi:hypothetical protein